MWRDPHAIKKNNILEHIEREKISLVCHTQAPDVLPPSILKKMPCPVKWLPCSINPDIFKDYGFKRIYDVILVAQLRNRRVYPLRVKIADILQKHQEIKSFVRQSPGYSHHLDITKEIVHENYAKMIAQSKIFPFGCGKIGGGKSPSQKLYEITSCNTLVMMDTPKNIKELHFKPEEDFVIIDENNLLEKIRYYLKHDNERVKIAQKGYETVRKYHTNEIRAKQLIRFLEVGDMRKEIYNV